MVICDTTKSQQQDQLPISHSTNRIALVSTGKEQQINRTYSSSSLSVLGSCNIGNSTPGTIQNNEINFTNGDCEFDNNNRRIIDGNKQGPPAENQLQQLNTMREALFAQDGWGCQHVNQDTNWEVPSSPEPSNKDSSGTQLWKPSINNGTDLWESNLRNGGQPPSQPIQKTPWSHTPSSNLGGTWGEDDDGSEGNNVWTGTGGNQGNGAVVIASGNSTNVSSVGPNAIQPQWNQNNVSVNVNTNNNANIASSTNISGVTTTGLNNATGVNVGGTNNSSGTNNNNGNVWGDPRDMRSGQVTGSLDIRNADVRDSMRASSAGDTREMRMLDPRDPIRGDPRGISGRLNGTSEMWGQHQSIAHSQMPAPINKMIGPNVNSGSINTNSSSITGSNVVSVAGVGTTNTSSINTTPTSVPTQWGNTQTAIGTKEMASLQSGNKAITGWEEPSPPPQRRNIPNYDDGTSLWSQQSRVPVSGSHWKDISDPISRSHMIRSSMCTQNINNPVPINNTGVQPTGTNVCTQNISSNPNSSIQNRLTSASIPPKSDSSMWSHASSSGRGTSSWTDDGNHNLGTNVPNWAEEKPVSNIGQIGTNVGNANTWNDSNSVWNKHNQNKITSSGWGSSEMNGGDISSEWNSHPPMINKPPQKLNSGIGVDMIKQSKQYRILIENGFKKEEVERALMSSNMNLEEAAEMLRASVFTADNWRRQDETIGSFSDHSGTAVVGGFPGRYPAGANQSAIAFPPNNILNSIGSSSTVGINSNNPNIPALNSLQTIQVQKYLNQSSHNVTTPGSGSQAMNTFVQASGNSAVNSGATTSNQPSAQQLRMLVQQIQLAVQSGYLSSQILNQPLAPTTLLLLNQLLTSIKHLQGAQQTLSRGSNGSNLQINVAIAKYKQQIQNLQNQINAQQAIYIKQQSVQQSSHNAPTPHSNSEFLRGHDAMIQNNFSDITLNKTGSFQGTSNHQSRLNQWKLPMLEKDVATDNADFSRAPGTTKTSLNPPNIGSLTLQNDGAWSAGRNIGDGWPEATSEENKDWPVAQPSTASSAYTDLVQEFEPGKPWKGSQIKTIEDDPSITPGSVARSPLSISSTPKDADLFSANNTVVTNKSPTDLPSLALTSSTWSFLPSASNNQNFPSWVENQQCAASELWTTPMNKSSRGPPPGLGGNVGKNIVSSSVSNTPNSNLGAGVCSNGWLVGNGGPRNNSSNANIGWTPSATNNSWNSNWLLLKNLNAQIDGSTLRTLCIQHGPLLNFQLYLNQGIALCKYATREEANKAQMTLNNCVLGSTTICAESPNETEVQNILQHLPQAQQSLQQPATLPSLNSGSLNPNGNNITSGNIGGNNSGGGVGGNGGSGSSSSNVVNSNSSNNTNITTANNTQAHNIAVNSNSGSSNSPSNMNAPGGSNQTTWRQQSQNQSRPTGRENDFDYISKYVCSIVDD